MYFRFWKNDGFVLQLLQQNTGTAYKIKSRLFVLNGKGKVVSVPCISDIGRMMDSFFSYHNKTLVQQVQ
jgi:arginine/ornithine N-succinyltransferase beta subunit